MAKIKSYHFERYSEILLYVDLLLSSSLSQSRLGAD